MAPKTRACAHAPWKFLSPLVGYAGRQHAPHGPIVLEVWFFVPKPEKAPRSVVLPVKRADFDNLFHELTDQWTGVFWHDDSQIVDGILRKRSPRGDRRVGAPFRIHVMTLAEIEAELAEQRQAAVCVGVR